MSLKRQLLGLIPVFLVAGLTQGAVVIDANVSTDRPSASSTVASPGLSTTAANELLLAFVATDYLSGTNTTVKSVAGGGLTWVLVVRANAQSGSSEIWRAFTATSLSNVTVTATLSQSVVASMTVISFAGVNTSGTNGSGAIGATASKSAASGAPTASLTTTAAGSLVFGVGNDFDNAIARTVGPGQTLLHQYLTPTGDTYWLQMQTNPIAASGTSVTINDTAPTKDRYNLSICEIVANGSITPTVPGMPTSVSASAGNASATVSWTAPSSNGGSPITSYTVTPFIGSSAQPATVVTGTPPATMTTVSGLTNGTAYTFTVSATNAVGTGQASAPSKSVTPTGPTAPGTPTGVSATAGNASATVSWTAPSSNGGSPITSYTVTPFIGSAAQPATVVTGTPPATMTTVSGLTNGTAYTFTVSATNAVGTGQPSAPSYSVTPTAPTAPGTPTGVSATAGNASATVSWTAPSSNGSSPITSYTVTPFIGSAAQPATVVTGTPPATMTTVSGLTNGTAYTFTVSATNAVGTGQASAPSNSVTPSGVSSSSISIDVSASTDAQSASKTIATSLATSGSNELLLAFIATDYLSGTNTTVTGVSGGGLTWTLVVRSNAQSGSSEIWRAFAAKPLSNFPVTATLSQSVICSMTVMGFTGVSSDGTNGSGAIGAVASKSAGSGAPTATLTTRGTNSLVFGVGNDYDNAIARTVGTGQTLLHQYLTPTGDTYWLQMQTNAVPASGTSVTINDTAPTKDRYNLSLVEIVTGSGSSDTTPPNVSMTSPAPSAAVASLLTVSANASDNNYITGVQFLLDGNLLGSQVTMAPYSMTWNSTTAANGTHTLAARATDSVGLTTTSTPVTITVDNSGNSAVVGSWSSVVSLPAVAVNLILLQNNRVLFYQDGATPTVWDYVLNTFTNVPVSPDLFCSGHALLSDGRILVVGGYGGNSAYGISNAEIFDPSKNTWTSVPNMAYKRWYPNATTLPDGRILVTAGWQTNAHTNAGISEIYDPVLNNWTQLSNANNPFETYPFMYVLPDGRIIHLGGSEYATDTDVLDLTTTSWSVIDPNIVDGASATMYVPGKFMKAGTATDSQGVGPSFNTTYILDMTQPSPAWRQTPSMAYARSFLNLTTLPDGTVLATGGESDRNGGTIANAVYAAELWSPTTQTWTTMSSMHTPREYHGTALLLPDGRVLVSGMGADFGNVPDEKSAEFYSPPYLFKGARPTITQAPTQMQYGSNVFVGTPDATSIASVTLIRTGAVTHFFDENTRFVPLSFTQASGGLTVTAPVNSNLAPPGYYMLFIVNSAGVPSIAPFVQIP